MKAPPLSNDDVSLNNLINFLYITSSSAGKKKKHYGPGVVIVLAVRVSYSWPPQGQIIDRYHPCPKRVAAKWDGMLLRVTINTVKMMRWRDLAIWASPWP